MLFKNIQRFATRNLTRTIIILILSALATILVTISTVMYVSSRSYIKKAKSAYTVIAQFEQIRKEDFPLRDLEQEGLTLDWGDQSTYSIPFDKMKPITGSSYIKQYFKSHDFLEGVTKYNSIYTPHTDGYYIDTYVFKFIVVGEEESDNMYYDSNIYKAQVIETLYGKESFKEIELFTHYNYNNLEVEIGETYYGDLKFDKYLNSFDWINIYKIDNAEQEKEIRESHEELSTYLRAKEKSVNTKYIRNLEAILAFNIGESFITTGTKFTQDDYDNGNDVCIISELYAIQNNLNVGDHLDISYEWYYTLGTWWGLLADLSEYTYTTDQVNKSYEIIGIYKYKEVPNRLAWEINPNYVYIPYKNIEKLPTELSEVNINRYYYSFHGWQSDTFEIADGDSIDPFLREIENAGIDLELIKFNFYDQGYRHVANILKNMESNATLFMIGSIILMTVIGIVISYMYIVKRKKEIAILRVLGVKKRKVGNHLILSVIILILIGCIIGASVCMGSYRTVLMNSMQTEFRNIDESENVGEVKEIPINEIMNRKDVGLISVISSCFIITVIVVISFIQIFIILRKEPIRLLS